MMKKDPSRRLLSYMEGQAAGRIASSMPIKEKPPYGFHFPFGGFFYFFPSC
jgi:hypothetical protein